MNFATIIIMVSYFGGDSGADAAPPAPPKPQKIDYKAKCEDAQQKSLCNENAADTDEAAWKRRVLMEFAEGHGNIIMFYDAYRGGFCYYSDLNTVPYAVLINVAYKYVITYKCVSFLTAEAPEDEPGTAPPKTNTYQVNSFEAKMRSGCGVASAAATPPQPQKKTCVKIIRTGKICDFSFLSKAVGSEKVAISAAKPVSYSDFILQLRQRQQE